MSPRVAILGGTSAIAVAVARRYADRKARLVLVGRDLAALEREQADLLVRGAEQVVLQQADFADLAALPEAAQAAWTAFGGLDLTLVAYGSLPEQAECAASAEAAAAALALNFNSPALLLGELANRFEAQRAGVIAAISSVAGDRGRQSNYVYGAAKGGLQRFLEGLRHRLHPAGVAVLDIRPGFVSTPMTAHLPQGGPLWATPEKVAGDILAAIDRRKAVLYTPWFWRFILLIVRSLPRPIFHRSKL
ncbi:SDR family oxidoreductase [Roseococcus sp. SYP-B2431]|uniref:SDR family oxidoreductase n=1 Tax=Roseococcus sp. SYP-B2431 TaxID=2496640 RepID=UPI00103DC6AB|nr:SDR family oxidoreductase [Roseococcus sp. SYP-B2431]TCH99669.1 SDR family oxidoreductase [Roseococcus sp. SYP-B2431]